MLYKEKSDFSAGTRDTSTTLPGVNVIWINHVQTQCEFKMQVKTICSEALCTVFLSPLSPTHNLYPSLFYFFLLVSLTLSHFSLFFTAFVI